jgi:AcrR family transcriptional regulator
VFAEQSRSAKFARQEPASPLPRGRTDLSREGVADHQRERVIAAIATMLAERGYGELTVERIITGARISRTTFYDLFANKQAAVLFAQETLFQRFIEAIRAACEEQQEWPEKVKAAIATTLDFAEARPAQTQLLAAEFLAGDPAIAARARSSHDRLADLLGEGRRHYPKTAALPPMTEQALISALRSLITRGLVMEEAEQIAGMGSQLVELTLIPYLGSAASPRSARRHDFLSRRRLRAERLHPRLPPGPQRAARLSR